MVSFSVTLNDISDTMKDKLYAGIRVPDVFARGVNQNLTRIDFLLRGSVPRKQKTYAEKKLPLLSIPSTHPNASVGCSWCMCKRGQQINLVLTGNEWEGLRIVQFPCSATCKMHR